MNLRIERDALLKAIRTCLPAIKSGAGLPVISGIRIDITAKHTLFTATDLDLTIRHTASTGGTKTTVVVGAKILERTITTMPAGAIELTVNDGTLDINAGTTTATLRTIPTEEWPKISESEAEAWELTAADIAQLRRVIPAASLDQSRSAIMMGVEIAEGVATATDSYRLHSAQLNLDPTHPPFLIPAHHLAAVCKTAGDEPADIQIDTNDVTISTGTATFTMRQISGQYPKWQNLIPSRTPLEVRFHHNELSEAIDRCAHLAKLGTGTIKLDFLSDTECTISANASEVGSTATTIAVDGEGVQVCFSTEYLAGVLNSSEPDTEGMITLRYVDSLKPALVTDDRFTALIMPVRLS